MFQVVSLLWIRNTFGKPRHCVIVEVDENGQIVRSLHDPTGGIVPDVSEVHDDGDVLWLGSFRSNFVSRLELKD